MVDIGIKPFCLARSTVHSQRHVLTAVIAHLPRTHQESALFTLQKICGNILGQCGMSNWTLLVVVYTVKHCPL